MMPRTTFWIATQISDFLSEAPKTIPSLKDHWRVLSAKLYSMATRASDGYLHPDEIKVAIQEIIDFRREATGVQNTETIRQCSKMSEAGQKEYAHEKKNGFANFDRVARALDLHRHEIICVYMLKHVDGITSWVNGHKSQREDVGGRFCDLITYLGLLGSSIISERSK